MVKRRRILTKFEVSHITNKNLMWYLYPSDSRLCTVIVIKEITYWPKQVVVWIHFIINNVDSFWMCFFLNVKSWIKFFSQQLASICNLGVKIFQTSLPNTRSSRLEVFCQKGVLKNLAKFTGKHLCQSLYFNKVAGLKTSTLLKKRLWHRCFPVSFANF